KPDNIQVGQFGEVLVCDWGLGKIVGAQDDNCDELMFNADFLNSFTLSGAIKGTPGFMAPEQISQEYVITEFTDIYSLGCLLYCLLYQQAPFSGSTETILDKTKKNEFSFPSGDNVPVALMAIIKKCMVLEPEKRYRSVERIQEDLRRYMSGYMTLAEDVNFLRQARLFYQRNKIQSISLIVISLIIIFSSTVYSISMNKQRLEALKLEEIAAQRALDASEQARRAEKALSLYKNEVWWRAKIVKDHKRLFTSDVIHDMYYSSLIFKHADTLNKPIAYLDRLIENLPLERQLRLHRGRAYALSQQFSKSAKDFSIGEPKDRKNTDLKKLSEKYDELKPRNSRFIPREMLPDFIEDLCKVRDYFVKYKVMNYHIQHDDSLELKLIYIKNILHFSNPAWNSNSFRYDEKTRYLEIDGHSLWNYGFSFRHPSRKMVIQSIFSYLPVRILSVNGIHHKSMVFWNSKCQVMDISAAQDIPGKDILGYLQAKEIRVNQQQYDKVSTYPNPHKVKIVISDNTAVK
ncbi:MAG: protein kinase, partial [Lentisphaeraceae bacterium]|nr:protein kinase [Lentisphaeraceae bacterium]